MKQVTSSYARTHLSQLLGEVQQGETVEITRRGRPVAHLTAESTPQPRGNVEETIATLREFRKGNRLDGLTIRELIDEGRR